jgi:hypothetical protein
MNHEQQFSRDLRVGEVVGVRSWRVRGGWLRPVTARTAPFWGEGPQHAACYGQFALLHAYEALTDEEIEAHSVGGLNCTCGFYAYHHGRPSFHIGSDMVDGIIRGWGVATIGTKGFRCEYAEIVALVDPSMRSRAVRWFSRMPIVPTMALAAAFSTAATFVPIVWLADLCGALGITGLLVWMGVAIVKPGFLWGPPPSDEEMAILRYRYPNAEFYPTLRAAKKAHPLTDGPKRRSLLRRVLGR